MKNSLFKSLLAVGLAMSMTLSIPAMAASSIQTSAIGTKSTVATTPESKPDSQETQTPEAEAPSVPPAETETETPPVETETETPPVETETETPPVETEAPPVESETAPGETEVPPTETQTPETEETTPENDSTKAFVSRLYETILLRNADPLGLREWTELLNNHQSTGSDIISGFIHSVEFQNQNHSNDEFISILYRALFDREADPTGMAQWNSALDAHLSRDYVCSGFIGSKEYMDLCQKYNILPGTWTLKGILDQNPDTTKFVYRLYRLILDRDSDPKGLSEWVEALVSKRNNAAKVIEGFVFSDEFKNKNLNDSDYIEILYKTLLDRPSDPVGKENWLKFAQKGISRAYILNDFIGSKEFTDLCNKFGIPRGNIVLTENRDKNIRVTEYVNTVFRNIYNRPGTATDLNVWTGKLHDHNASAPDFVRTLIFSNEAKPFVASDTDFVKVLYKAALFRNPSETEISKALTKLQSVSRASYFNSIVESTEFSSICNKWEVPNYKEGWNKSPLGMYYIKNGKALTGWQYIGGKKYYLDPSKGGVRAEGFAYVDGYKLYFNDGILNQNIDRIIGRQSSYLVKVNTYTNTVTAYAKDGANGYIIPVKTMICSTGCADTPTIKGTFKIRRFSRWGTLMGPVYGQYCSQIYGDYLFHSAWYYKNGNARTLSVSEYLKLGRNASHGCVRMTVGDAKWIYDNCNGSTVTVYSSRDKGPFDKPARPNPVRISGDYGYDPTDPLFR